MKAAILAFVIFTLVGCNNDDGEVLLSCKSPVEFSNQRNETTSGFLVGINEGKDVNVEATRLLEEYSDLEVFSTFIVCNCFHANSSEETISSLQCEENISFLEYNNAAELIM